MSVVQKLYREFDEVTIDLQQWELLDTGCTVLWGASGAGKTSIIKVLVGLDAQADLVWSWGEQQMQELTPANRNLGVVFQEPALFPHLSVEENIFFPVIKTKHKSWLQDFEFLISELALESLLTATPLRLSGGEKQRVALARALIFRPRMLILDEPFSSLDGASRQQAREMVKLVCEKQNIPILLVTHDQQDVDFLANKVSHLEKGRIVTNQAL